MKNSDKEKRAVLWISLCVPYDKVPHAGGKTHNLYLKGLHKSGLFNIKLITFARQDDLPKIDLDDYGIDHQLIIGGKGTNIFKRAFFGVWGRLHRWNFLARDAGLTTPSIRYNVLKILQQLKRSGYVPDVIILQWTQIVLLREDLARIFPNVPVVAIEEEVTYLDSKSYYDFETSTLKRYIRRKLYLALKRIELQVLHDSSLVIVNNVRDEKLLQTDGDNINMWRCVPYFNSSYLQLEHKGGTKDIIFYGAMGGDGNYLTAEWFIKNVMPLLSADYRFIIIGNNPHASLMKYKSDRVIITGFVDDPSTYFQSALCLAAPFVIGAGIKVKVLESLSAGIPVLTNHIGIGGIEAVNGESYFHCETPQEYADTIRRLGDGEIDIAKVSEASKKLIREKYNYNETLKGLIDRMESITHDAVDAGSFD